MAAAFRPNTDVMNMAQRLHLLTHWVHDHQEKTEKDSSEHKHKGMQ